MLAQQTLAMLEADHRRNRELTLLHEGNKVRRSYSQLPRPVLIGIEVTGSMHWFLAGFASAKLPAGGLSLEV